MSIPSWRLDCETEIDIIEEIARAYGYSRIPKVVPLFNQSGGLSPQQQARRKLSDFLSGLELSEVISLPFLAPGDIEAVGVAADAALKVANPLVMEESVLRTSLRPGLLKTAAYNRARRQTGVRIFELGNVFSDLQGELAAAESQPDLPSETEHLAVLLEGSPAEEIVKVWVKLCLSLGIAGPVVTNSAQPGLHPTRSGILAVRRAGAGDAATAGQPDSKDLGETLTLGVIGEIDPAILRGFDLEPPMAWLELDVGKLLEVLAAQPRLDYKAPTRFPSSDIDLSFLVPEAISAAEVGQALILAGGENLASVELFDVYRGSELSSEGEASGSGASAEGSAAWLLG